MYTFGIDVSSLLHGIVQQPNILLCAVSTITAIIIYI